jgi:hypothetical protein
MQFRQQSGMIPMSRGMRLAAALAALTCGAEARSDASPSQGTLLAPADLQAWQEKSFAGHTLYRVEEGGRGPALHAVAQGSASVLCRTVAIDLESRPVVRWHWRLDRAPDPRNERSRAGDDQGLRLSALHRAGPAEEETLAIQYVWSQSEPVGAAWPNAFVANARELAARSGPAQPGVWRSERRDLQADFRAAFGRDVDRIDAVCLMSDGDQTGALVEGWYGDIIFQAR